MQGMRVALGTDCAISTNSSPSSIGQLASVASPARALHDARADQDDRDRRDPADAPSPPHANAFQLLTTRPSARKAANSTPIVSSDAPHAPALDRDLLALGRHPPELGEEVAAVLLEVVAQLRRARDAARRGERLGDLVLGEVAERVRVDALGVAAQREDEHHVGEVDRLPPRRGPDLDEEHVDQLQLAVAHHQVRRLDVAVRESLVPQLPDQAEPLVDHAVVDLGVADLDRAVEELHHDHVLALGGDLDDPVRPGDRDPEVVQQAERVVLVLDEPAHGLERLLVLESAVQDRAAELVPAVGPHVALRVELGEDVALGLVVGRLDLDPQRRRAAGPLQAHGLDVQDRQSRAGRGSPRRSPRRAGRRRRGGPSCPAGRTRGTDRWARTSGSSRRRPPRRTRPPSRRPWCGPRRGTRGRGPGSPGRSRSPTSRSSGACPPRSGRTWPRRPRPPRPAIGLDGIEYPCHPVRIGIPRGRGRAMIDEAL